ncbi:hypothetical protein HEK616_36690 [Streptomyces nigrescens]|uniref:NAD(P)-binding domain-containing protein n=1 Tax=Streptomyces nigrescens TaxID=1920 RepID=A0ABM7ZV33_STRNI|nr:hypothetical protein HEK616_36690 [Streptomyces nigrescens]
MLIVTGATGQLGRLVVEHLLELVPADQVAAVVRDPGKAADLAARGIQLRTADYDKPHSLAGAFGAGDRVLLISGNDTARRVPQHLAVIEAAKAAGVAQLAYTSILGGGAGRTVFAAHHTTEQAIQDSGLPYTFLRNGWYTEIYTAQLPTMLEHGVLLGAAAPDSRIASATRADYAAAAPRSYAAKATTTRSTSSAATTPGASPSTPSRHPGNPADPSPTSNSPPTTTTKSSSTTACPRISPMPSSTPTTWSAEVNSPSQQET